MQSGNILKAITKESNEGTEATNIVISQISLLISTLTEGNFSEIETRINYILSKSSIRVYLRYWDRLLAYAESYILKNRKLDIRKI